MNDHDTYTPSLDGPAGQSFRRRSAPPEVPSFAEPIGTRRLTITASTFDGSESMVLVDRPDFPIWPDDSDELEPDPACAAAAARVRAAFASGRTDSPSPDAQAAPDAVTPAADRSEPTPSAVTPSRRSCAHCGRALGSWRRDDARYCSGACRVAAHRDPARGDVVAKAERRERKGTPALFAKEAGR